MKKIHDIISSELVARTNNIKYRQEFGRLGESSNIVNEGDSTVFTTEFKIDKILFLTVNGINLIEGLHYYVESDFKIYISNSGDPLKVFSGQVTEILVGYMFENIRYGENKILIPPVISTFYLNRNSGRNDKIIFNFIIEEKDGKNIYWSILKDGGDIPLYSGSNLKTENGFIIDTSGNLIELDYYISRDEYLDRIGEDIPFTLVVVYDLTDDGSHLDEKILKDVNYTLLSYQPITGSITSTPPFIDSAGVYTINIDWSIINISNDSYQWEITRQIDNGIPVIIDSGTTTIDYNGTYIEDVTTLAGQSYDIRYWLNIKSSIDIDFVDIANDRTTISVPAIDSVANAGYIDEAVMNYYDSTLAQWVTIGSLSTPQDLVEYNSRVVRDTFTKEVTENYIDSGSYIQAPVWNPSGTIARVYFVIEIPKSWGPIHFYQPTGEVPITAFNVIDLNNGLYAYLYAEAPSSSTNPSDYTLKSL